MKLLYTTLPTQQQAEQMAEDLVMRKLAACVNILQPCTSMYTWQGKFTREQEVPMLIKTAAERVDAVMQEVKRLHPYDVPAIYVIPVEKTDSDYLNWVHTQTQG